MPGYPPPLDKKESVQGPCRSTHSLLATETPFNLPSPDTTEKDARLEVLLCLATFKPTHLPPCCSLPTCTQPMLKTELAGCQEQWGQAIPSATSSSRQRPAVLFPSRPLKNPVPAKKEEVLQTHDQTWRQAASVACCQSENSWLRQACCRKAEKRPTGFLAASSTSAVWLVAENHACWTI